jgi:FkbM family methyltransferase
MKLENSHLKFLTYLGLTVSLINLAHYFLDGFDYGEEKQPQRQQIKIVDLNSQPEDETDSAIRCRKSATIVINTTLCIIRSSNDDQSSDDDDDDRDQEIIKHGVHDSQLLALFMDYLIKYPDLLVFDIGANIGQFTLFAAKFKNYVISVEPFVGNLLSIAKAARLEGIESFITLLNNDLSESQSVTIRRAITLNNLVDLIPFNLSLKKTPRSIMKLSVEAIESKAIYNSARLFASVDLIAILM